MPSAFQELLDQVIQPPGGPEAEAPLPEEPADLRPAWNRALKTCKPPSIALEPALSLEEAREMIESRMQSYLAQEFPTGALLVKAPPGTGKTYTAVRQAERCAASGRRVLYCGPRHDLFDDVVRMTEHRSWWYEWQPRQAENEEKGKPETCMHAAAIASWLARGYKAMDFCRGVCGWDYVNGKCVYHAQRQRKEPIVFGQHQHVWGGHPLDFRVLIGDESPLSAFCWEWSIPGKFVTPAGMEPTDPITELLHDIQSLCESDARVEGTALLATLGGATRVRESIEASNIPATAMAWSPEIHNAYEVEKLPYFHLFDLVNLLERECKAAEAGKEYPARVIVSNGYLILLLRRRVSEQMPAHIVWLDATAEEHLYESILGRPVEIVAPRLAMKGRIYQVYDRANGKATLADQNGKATDKTGQLKKQVKQLVERNGYKRVGIITHMAIEPEFKEYEDRGHFFGERGTNRFDQVDALVVAGVPQPPLFQMEKAARMLFWERMRPFKVGSTLEWSTIEKPYNYVAEDGQGRSYPASGFWGDPDLASILWQYREAELIQAAHRARPNLREVDIWLLENLPVDELAPTKLYAIRDLFGAPKGVDCYRWPEVAELAELFAQEGRELTAKDLREHLGVKHSTMYSYLAKVVQSFPDQWEWALLPTKGRPRRVLRPRTKGGAYPLYIVGKSSA